MKGAIKFVLIALSILQFSCVSTRCVVCDSSSRKILNVHLKSESNQETLDFGTFFEPTFSKEQGTVKIHIFNCDQITPEILNSDSVSDYMLQNMVSLDTSFVDYFSTSSDIDYPATKVQFEYSKDQLICNRERKNLKIETRLMAGMRNLSLTSVYFPGYDGGSIYQKEWFSFDDGGTVLTTGFELGITQKMLDVGNGHVFSLGLMTGFWPVDGGLHIPLAIHPRLTFNNNTNPFAGNCNAWYLFGDYGTTVNASGDVPFYDNKIMSTFWDLGIGVDLFQTRNRDFSIDMGYRQTKLAMPINQYLLDCLSEADLPIIDLYPKRAAGQVFIRFGFTF